MYSSSDSERNSEDRGLLKQDLPEDERKQAKLKQAINDLSASNSRDALIKIREITSSNTGSLSNSLSTDFDHYRGPTQNDYECHICTIITCTICWFLAFITMIFILILLMIGGIDIESIDLHSATANVEMTILSKWSYLDFIDTTNTITKNNSTLSDNIINAFISATALKNTNETKDMFNVSYKLIEPLFGNHLKHHTKVKISANISSERAMDKMLSSMVIEKRRNKEIISEYTPEYLSNLETSLKTTIDKNMSVWYVQHEFEYPIVCTTELHINKITRGTIIGGMMYAHNSMKEWIHPWKHEDVEPKQMFYVGDIIGQSFVTKSIFSHHYILCDMTKRMSKYMNEELKHGEGPFKVKIEADTVRCCVAPDGNIKHDLPSNQCVGHRGDRRCLQYE